MNPNHACCGDTFSNVPLYLQHLKTHEDNTNIMIKCIICGQTCINWISFRKHNTRNHKDNNPLEIFDQYTDMVDDLIVNDLNETSVNGENNIDTISEKDRSFEYPVNFNNESRDFEKTKQSYAQFLLEITYQYKLTVHTVDSLNENTKKLVLIFLNDL